jgi:hypothetical protein
MVVSGSIMAVSGENRWVTLLKSECGQLQFQLSPRISTSDVEVTDGGIPLSDITMVCSCSCVPLEGLDGIDIRIILWRMRELDWKTDVTSSSLSYYRQPNLESKEGPESGVRT